MPRQPWLVTTLTLVIVVMALDVEGMGILGTSKSIGQSIQESATVSQLLQVASYLWLPTDEDLPPHFFQPVHHEKRQRWAGQLLGKMGALASGGDGGGGGYYDGGRLASARPDGDDMKHLCRAAQAAAMPGPTSATDDNSNRSQKSRRNSARTLTEALVGLSNLVSSGRVPALLNGGGEDNSMEALMLQSSILQMVGRIEPLVPAMELKEVLQARWAIRSLFSRCGLSSSTPSLDQRVSGLPFDIVPNGVDWSRVLHGGKGRDEIVEILREDIPFNFDTIVTRDGSSVVERRGTAWVVEEAKDIGALAYSGKLMPPHPLPNVVKSTMKEVERLLELNYDDNEEDHASPAFFDCALCNYYPYPEAACKFHTDPEHGTFWDRLTCVVSAGDSRNFAFKPIRERCGWDDYNDPRGGARGAADAVAPAVYRMWPGDVVVMRGTCNDDFYHAVYSDGRGDGAGARSRVSLVLKRAIDRNGRRGHGLSGRGRRNKKNRTRKPH